MAPISTDRQRRQLAQRTNDGIDVILLSNPHDRQVTVDVFDARTGEQFPLHAPPADGLAVFHHPFAYAARPAVSA